MKTKLTVKQRKRLARLKREMREMEDWAYKHDLDESRIAAGDRLNRRYEIAAKEVKAITGATTNKPVTP